jgi:hypothetical protein
VRTAPVVSRVPQGLTQSSGFDRDDEWGFRALEPSRCCISSIALVNLKTGIVHHDDGRPVTVDYNQLQTAQKLLLFWRKPAVRARPSASRVRLLTRGRSASAGGTASRSSSRARASRRRQ